MGEITKINEGELITLIKEGGDLNKPFGQEVFLLETLLAGTTHAENIKELEPDIKAGLKVNFYRETSNKYDPKAIVVKEENGQKLGYIPKEKNEILSRLMDAGKLIYGIVDHKEYQGNWLKIKVKIYLDD